MLRVNKPTLARKGMTAKKSFRSVVPAKLSSKVQPALVTVTAGQ